MSKKTNIFRRVLNKISIGRDRLKEVEHFSQILTGNIPEAWDDEDHSDYLARLGVDETIWSTGMNQNHNIVRRLLKTGLDIGPDGRRHLFFTVNDRRYENVQDALDHIRDRHCPTKYRVYSRASTLHRTVDHIVVKVYKHIYLVRHKQRKSDIDDAMKLYMDSGSIDYYQILWNSDNGDYFLDIHRGGENIVVRDIKDLYRLVSK